MEVSEIVRFLEEARSDLPIDQPLEAGDENRGFYHYTSIRTLFSILESDSLWAGNARFSNDASEARGDNFILCFCDRGDQLSQWRGYCPNGGASIKMDVQLPMKFSVLHSDYNESKKYEECTNQAVPVRYIEPDRFGETREQLRRRFGALADMMFPFLKSAHFREERESRILFSNASDFYSRCVRFRTLQDGAMVPYLVIKAGNVGDERTSCPLETDEAGVRSMLYVLRERRQTVLRIPNGHDQESVYYKIRPVVNEFNRELERAGDSHIRIYCEGHLPIQKITISPMPDNTRTMEEVARFCRQKYWLQEMLTEDPFGGITISNIPYVAAAV